MTRRPLDYYLLWGVALVSLLINVGFGYGLWVARARAAQGADTAAKALAALRAASFDYTVHVEQSLPVSLTVPFSTTVAVPISTTLPINTDFNFTLHTLLGDYPVTLPVRAEVPVNVRTSVPVRVMVPISTTVPVALDAPVHIDVQATALNQALEPAQTYLEQLAADLQRNPFLDIVPR